MLSSRCGQLTSWSHALCRSFWDFRCQRLSSFVHFHNMYRDIHLTHWPQEIHKRTGRSSLGRSGRLLAKWNKSRIFLAVLLPWVSSFQRCIQFLVQTRRSGLRIKRGICWQAKSQVCFHQVHRRFMPLCLTSFVLLTATPWDIRCSSSTVWTFWKRGPGRSQPHRTRPLSR